MKDRHPKCKNEKSLCWWVYLTISEHGCIESNLELNPYFAWEFYFSWKQLSKLISKFLNIWLVFSEAEAAGAWKVSKYGVIFGPYFPVFALNTEIYSVNLRIQSEYRKIRTRNNSVFGHFSRSELMQRTSPPPSK